MTYVESQRRLANVFSRINQWIYEKPASLEFHSSTECDRCGYSDCVCGTPEFESWVSQVLGAAEKVDR
jgi:hypothetical protein